jgi:hypothetical protein
MARRRDRRHAGDQATGDRPQQKIHHPEGIPPQAVHRNGPTIAPRSLSALPGTIAAGLRITLS